MKERIQMSIAWMLPRWLVYWAGVRIVAHASQGPWSNQPMYDIPAAEAVVRWTIQPKEGDRLCWHCHIGFAMDGQILCYECFDESIQEMVKIDYKPVERGSIEGI